MEPSPSFLPALASEKFRPISLPVPSPIYHRTPTPNPILCTSTLHLWDPQILQCRLSLNDDIVHRSQRRPVAYLFVTNVSISCHYNSETDRFNITISLWESNGKSKEGKGSQVQHHYSWWWIPLSSRLSILVKNRTEFVQCSEFCRWTMSRAPEALGASQLYGLSTPGISSRTIIICKLMSS